MNLFRSRVIRHTLVLLVTTSAAQAAGVVYAQPGERKVAHVAALSAAALANVRIQKHSIYQYYQNFIWCGITHGCIIDPLLHVLFKMYFYLL